MTLRFSVRVFAEAPRSQGGPTLSEKHHADAHHPHGHGHHGKSPAHPPPRGLHHDWRTWVVIGLMLAAMVIYILSIDESVRPGVRTQPQIPAATGE